MSTLKETLEKYSKEYNNDLSVLLDYLDDETTTEEFDNVREELEQGIQEQEVIYHASAMEYLAENDPSLIYSIEIACSLGYELKNVNSELLATLLYQQNLSEELENFANSLNK